MPHTRELTPDVRDCIQYCLDCHAICVETTTHCLMLGGKHAEAHHVGTLMDCAQICLTSADFMLRVSPRHVRTCEVCADVCRTCAESCERMASGDETMQRCADLCRRCAQSCEQMSKVTA